MSKDASQAAASLVIARRLVERAAPSTTDDPAAVGAALQLTCSRIFARLRDALGDDGSNALLARALARVEGEHPALKKIRRLYGDSIHLDGVAAGIETFGAPTVVAAVEALLAALVDVLGRLIGEDMALRLIDSDARYSNSDARHANTNGKKAP